MTPHAPPRPDPSAPAPSRLDRVETVAVGIALALLTNALIGPLFSPSQKSTPEAAALRIVWPPVYAVGLLVAMRHWREMRRLWPAAAGFAFLLAWPFASKAWSLDPETTGRRCTALLFTTVVGFALAARYSWRQLATLLAVVLGALGALSLALGVVAPDFAINHTTNPNDWKGVWYEKNAFGANVALGAMAALSAALLEPKRRRLWFGVIAICLVGLLLSRSKTALLALMVGAAVIGALSVVRRGPAWAVIAGWIAVQGAALLAAIAWLAPDLLLKAIGKDPTLTGRTDIWAALLRRVAERPMLGYGFQAFWSADRHGPAAVIRKETHWMVPSAHNGWLDLLVQLGWIGVALFAAAYAVIVGRAAAGAARRPDGGFALAYVAVFGVFSLSESYIFQHNSLSWVLFAAVTAKLFEAAPAAVPAVAGVRRLGRGAVALPLASGA